MIMEIFWYSKIPDICWYTSKLLDLAFLYTEI